MNENVERVVEALDNIEENDTKEQLIVELKRVITVSQCLFLV